jgi:Peptidase family M28
MNKENTMTAYVKPIYAHTALPLLTADDVPNDKLMQTLYRACSVRRASGSLTEGQFVAWLCARVPVTLIDEAGNIHVDTRTGSHNRTLFTSHTDTAHHDGGANAIRLDTSNPLAIKWRADEGSCLGADDGAGIALMVHMIEAGVKGLFVFFRGEEVGGVGSSWLANNIPHSLADIDRCVSLDRAGYSDVITHQAGERCSSDTFGIALATVLTPEDFSLAFLADSTGVFTDSANLTRIVAECTNLSVGYAAQHGDGEWQDVTFLQRLAAQLVTVAWDALPVERKPFEVEKNGKNKGAYPAYWDDTFKIDAFDEFLIDALYDAVDASSAELRGIIAEHLMPEDPSQALPHIRVANVHSTLLEAYADGLRAGEYDTYQILDILAQDCLVN